MRKKSTIIINITAESDYRLIADYISGISTSLDVYTYLMQGILENVIVTTIGFINNSSLEVDIGNFCLYNLIDADILSRLSQRAIDEIKNVLPNIVSDITEQLMQIESFDSTAETYVDKFKGNTLYLTTYDKGM